MNDFTKVSRRRAPLAWAGVFAALCATQVVAMPAGSATAITNGPSTGQGTLGGKAGTNGPSTGQGTLGEPGLSASWLDLATPTAVTAGGSMALGGFEPDFSALATSSQPVPEPSSWALMVAGLAGVCWRAWQRRPR